ncbi:MAG: hypothetical protein AAF125_22645, partial [Chloroflexota bacterium]
MTHTLIVVGIPGIGARALARCIDHHSEALATAGVFRPVVMGRPPYAEHRHIATYLHTYWNDRRPDDEMAYLRVRVHEEDAPRTLLHARNLHTMETHQITVLSEVLDGLGPVTVLFYLRNPLRWLATRWQGAVTRGETADDISTWIARQCAEGDLFSMWVERWTAVFGASVQVRFYESALASTGGLWGDFWRAATLPGEPPPAPVIEDTNAPLPHPLLDMLRDLNAQHGPSTPADDDDEQR